MICLKKIACFIACCLMASLITLTASAKESTVRILEEHIALSNAQKEFDAVIEIEPENMYAGVEIGIACPEGVAVTASSSSSGSMSAAPVLANGLYWTSFFESDNKLSGDMKITLQFSCSEAFENGNIVLEKVKVLTKDGAAVLAEELAPSLKLNVTRDDSDTTQSNNSQSSDTDADDSNNNANIAEEQNPATGEHGQLFGYVVILFVSGSVIFATMLLRVKKRKIH